MSATLATSNTQTLFQPTACYSIAGDIARGAHMRQNGKGWSDDGASPTVTTLDVPAVAFTQNQRDEVRLEGCDGQVVGAIAASPGSKNQHYVCMADDAAKSAVDCDMCGTLKRGGGTSLRSLPSSGEDYIGTLCARDYKGPGNQDIGEGKVIVQWDTSSDA